MMAAGSGAGASSTHVGCMMLACNVDAQSSTTVLYACQVAAWGYLQILTHAVGCDCQQALGVSQQ
jgi:hypothetical protein